MFKVLARDVAVILSLAVTLGVVYNAAFSVKPLPWIRQPRHIDTLSTDAIMSLLATASPEVSVTPASKQQIPDDRKSPPLSQGQDTTTIVAPPKGVEPRLPPQNNAISPHQEKGVQAVTYQQVLMMLRNEDVLFMDARRKDEYDQGHIPRAINVDIQLLELDPTYRNTIMQMLYSLDKRRPVVTYCGGGNCELSHKLSELLTSIGFDKVFIYLGGWNEYSSKPDSPREQ